VDSGKGAARSQVEGRKGVAAHLGRGQRRIREGGSNEFGKGAVWSRVKGGKGAVWSRVKGGKGLAAQSARGQRRIREGGGGGVAQATAVDSGMGNWRILVGKGIGGFGEGAAAGKGVVKGAVAAASAESGREGGSGPSAATSCRSR